MKVSFELSASDIRYFRDRLEQVRKSVGVRDEQLVIRSAAKLVKETVAAKPPDFVVERILKLEQLIEMLRDREWRLEGRDRERILGALAYFVAPDDIIPDRIPGIGYLDDAIMIELVARELTHELDAYGDFCEYREGRPKTEDEAKLEARREALQARMRRRRRRERSMQRSSRKSSRSPLGLW
jgi:uncharacterized membrane protein YkvA (DUF1232 family)